MRAFVWGRHDSTVSGTREGRGPHLLNLLLAELVLLLLIIQKGGQLLLLLGHDLLLELLLIRQRRLHLGGVTRVAVSLACR